MNWRVKALLRFTMSSELLPARLDRSSGFGIRTPQDNSENPGARNIEVEDDDDSDDSDDLDDQGDEDGVEEQDPSLPSDRTPQSLPHGDDKTFDKTDGDRELPYAEDEPGRVILLGDEIQTFHYRVPHDDQSQATLVVVDGDVANNLGNSSLSIERQGNQRPR